MGTGLGAF